MEPEIIFAAKGFKATSGNRVVHVTDLGPDGMHAAWDLKPTPQDMSELEQWVATATQIPVTGVTRHNGGRTEAQTAYQNWVKNGNGRP